MMRLGYYGKVPERGDFIRFNLPQSLINVWDDWLQLALIQGEQTHTTLWSELYHSAPPHRFVCSRDIMGPESWFGVFVPSSDKVGRRFPFCIIGTASSPFNPVQGLLDFQDLLKTLEQLALNVSTGEVKVDALNTELDELSNSWVEHDTPDPLPKPMDADSFLVRSDSGKSGDLAAFTNALLDSYMQQHYQQVCVFQSCPRDTASKQRQPGFDTTNLFLSAGLPDRDEGLALFTDRFDPRICNVTPIRVLPPVESNTQTDPIMSNPSIQPTVEDPDVWDALQSIEAPIPAKQSIEESIPANQAEEINPAEPLEVNSSDTPETPVNIETEDDASVQLESEALNTPDSNASPTDETAQPVSKDPTTGIVGFAGKPDLIQAVPEVPDLLLTDSDDEDSAGLPKTEVLPESELPNVQRTQADKSKHPANPKVETLDIAEEDLSAMPWEDT